MSSRESDSPPTTPRGRKPKTTRASTAVLGVPTAAGELAEAGTASIVLIYPPDAPIGMRIELDGARLRLGRDPGCDVSIDRSALSRQHAELVAVGGGWRVRDLGSTNGTYLNDRPVVDDAPLRDGDKVRFGDVVFKFLSGHGIEQSYHDELYQLSVLDALTGLHNRRYFDDFLERELASAVRHGHPLTLVMFDLDHFKRVNDAHGHLVGDAVLRELAARVRPRLRREDLLARYGGEEFAAILPVTDEAGGVRFAEAVRALVAQAPFTADRRPLRLTISAGVATTPGVATTAAELTARADERLLQAKRAGRDRVVAGPGPGLDRR